MSLNINERMFDGNDDTYASYPDADPFYYLIWIQVMQILVRIYVSEWCPCVVSSVFMSG